MNDDVTMITNGIAICVTYMSSWEVPSLSEYLLTTVANMLENS